jgi:hypothetical protein
VLVLMLSGSRAPSAVFVRSTGVDMRVRRYTERAVLCWIKRARGLF